jgi:hypothetical protein
VNNAKNDEPIYDKQVEQILSLLEDGFSKEEVAAKLNYNNPVSLDNYMRRRNFSYDGRQRKFIPKKEKSAGFTPEAADISTQPGRAIAMLTQESADPKEVAQKLGFADHHELGAYMMGKGYEWDIKSCNYIKAEETQEAMQVQSDEIEDILGSDTSQLYGTDFAVFLPVLELLLRKKEKLAQLLGTSEATGQIPRYAVPGVPVTKSVHMMNQLDQMVRDYSREKNVSQRDLFEVALIEFFRKYGYEREVENLLKQS